MESTYEQISEIIRLELLKRGFNVNVNCTEKGKSFKVKTSSFQTIPVLFKEIFIESNSVHIEEKESNNGVKYTEYRIKMSVHYEHFDGGENGCNLFTILLRQIEKSERMIIVSMN